MVQVQVMPQEQNLWSSIGAGLGGGLQQGLQYAAQKTFDARQQQKQLKERSENAIKSYKTMLEHPDYVNSTSEDKALMRQAVAIEYPELSDFFKSQQDQALLDSAYNRNRSTSAISSDSSKKGTVASPESIQQEELSDEEIGRITTRNPPLGKVLQDQKTANRKAKREDIAQDIKIHKLSEEHEGEVKKEAKSAQIRMQASTEARRLIKRSQAKGESLGPDSLASIFGNTPLGNFFKTGDYAALEANTLHFLEGAKDLFGVRLSDADLKLVTGKLVMAGKSNEANLAIMDLYESVDKVKYKLWKYSNSLKTEKGLRPLDYSAKMEAKSEEYFNDIEKALNEVKALPTPMKKKGKIYNIPNDMIEQARLDGFED